MRHRVVITFALSVSAVVGVGLGALVAQVAPGNATGDAKSITGVGSGVEGAGEQVDEMEASSSISPSQAADVDGVDTTTAVEVFTPNEAAVQSIRGITGIDTVMLQNLEAVLRMQTPPLPPQDGGGRAAALMTMESDQPPDPEAEPDGREELNEFELEGS